MNDSTISAHTALVYLMVLVSASDRDMTDLEIKRIGQIVQTLPVFDGYDLEHLVPDAETCADILDAEDGLEAVLGLVKEAVPDTHADTAYAVACDIAAVDGKLSQEEIRLLEIVRYTLSVDRLVGAAIERATAARRRSL